MDFEILNNEILVLVDKSVYSEDVVYKCFYWYGGGFNVTITSVSNTEYKIVLKPKTENLNLNQVIEKIQQDLVDFKLRDIVTKETKTIRELIVAKAFAYYGLEENPTSEVSDPVGFNPNAIPESTNVEL